MDLKNKRIFNNEELIETEEEKLGKYSTCSENVTEVR